MKPYITFLFVLCSSHNCEATFDKHIGVNIRMLCEMYIEYSGMLAENEITANKQGR